MIVVSESRVTWATSVPILVFLGLSVLKLGLMYETLDRRQTKASLNASALWGGGITITAISTRAVPTSTNAADLQSSYNCPIHAVHM